MNAAFESYDRRTFHGWGQFIVDQDSVSAEDLEGIVSGVTDIIAGSCRISRVAPGGNTTLFRVRDVHGHSILGRVTVSIATNGSSLHTLLDVRLLGWITKYMPGSRL